jgi:hypothetical protein
VSNSQASDNVVVTLDSEIDRLYQLPLGEFTAARNALAKTLTGGGAARVKALAKPTVVPWAVNQLYWRDRKTFDRLLKAGGGLREAQIAALGGRHADVRRATEAHRAALADAVRSATSLASAGGANPQADQLARMLEAVSLSATPADAAGRFTELIQPSGFEALAGLSISRGHGGAAKGGSHTEPRANPAEAGSHIDDNRSHIDRKGSQVGHTGSHDRKAEAERKREEARRAKEAAERRRAMEAAMRKAEHELAIAESALARAGRDVEQIEEALAAARARRDEALKTRDRARTALAHARQAASFG